MHPHLVAWAVLHSRQARANVDKVVTPLALCFACQDTCAVRCCQLQVGLVKSWSAYHTFLAQHPDKDPIESFKQELMDTLQAQVKKR